MGKILDKLENEKSNFLIISTPPKQVVFNDYKTNKTYRHQLFLIEGHMLIAILDKNIATIIPYSPVQRKSRLRTKYH